MSQLLLVSVLLSLNGFALGLVLQAGPFTPAPIVAGGQVFHTVYDYFCVNYTTQQVTFIGDIPNLYNASGLAWNQMVSVGQSNVLSDLRSSNFDCSTWSTVPALPTKIPVPPSAFENGINSFNNFMFPSQTGTQDTYQVLNPHGIAQAVQIIEDSTTNFQDTMRFFFKVNLASLGESCTSLGSSYSSVRDAASDLLQYTSNIPIVSIARSSAGTVLVDERYMSASQTPGNNLVISVTGGSHYQVDAFLESTFLDTTHCPTGQTSLILQFGMEFTSMDPLYLVQGPRSIAGITIDANCYNITVRSVRRLPCDAGGVCVQVIQLQTECRTALANGLTFASCDAGQVAAEESGEVFFDSRASYCLTNDTTCVQTGANYTLLYYVDKVRASVAFQAASQFLEVIQFYPSTTSALSQPLFNNHTLEAGDILWVATFFPYPEIQRNFKLTVLNSSAFSITGYDSAGKATNTLRYADLVKSGVIALGVKATRNLGAGLLACDNVLGCDDFALNADAVGLAFPGAAYLTFNLSTSIPGGYNGHGDIGTLVNTVATQALNISQSLTQGFVYTTKKSDVLVAAWVLTAVGGGSIVIGLIACLVYYSSSSETTGNTYGSVAMTRMTR